jgi:hypothetical protein
MAPMDGRTPPRPPIASLISPDFSC